MSGEREDSEPETTGGPGQATTPGARGKGDHRARGKGGRRETDGTRPHPGGRPLGC